MDMSKGRVKKKLVGAPGATRLVLKEGIKKSQRERYAKLAVERKKSQRGCGRLAT